MARVTVLPYDPAWKAAFDAIRQELGQGLGGMLEPLGGEQPRPVSCPHAPRAQRRGSCVARTAAGLVTPEDRNVGLCLFLF